MKFIEAEDDIAANLFCRRVSENGLVEIGVARVLFGYRVKAGFCGSLIYAIDWCAGAQWHHVESLYTMCINALSARDESKSCFQGIPGCSRIKPYFNDEQFIKDVASLIPETQEAITVKLDSTNIVRAYSASWL